VLHGAGQAGGLSRAVRRTARAPSSGRISAHPRAVPSCAWIRMRPWCRRCSPSRSAPG
jgi:hypothetical protein